MRKNTQKHTSKVSKKTRLTNNEVIEQTDKRILTHTETKWHTQQTRNYSAKTKQNKKK